MARFHLLNDALHVASRNQVLLADAHIERRLFWIAIKKVAERLGTDAQARCRLPERQNNLVLLFG